MFIFLSLNVKVNNHSIREEQDSHINFNLDWLNIKIQPPMETVQFTSQDSYFICQKKTKRTLQFGIAFDFVGGVKWLLASILVLSVFIHVFKWHFFFFSGGIRFNRKATRRMITFFTIPITTHLPRHFLGILHSLQILIRKRPFETCPCIHFG